MLFYTLNKVLEQSKPSLNIKKNSFNGQIDFWKIEKYPHIEYLMKIIADTNSKMIFVKLHDLNVWYVYI